jgi:hypothetical protein
MKKYFFALLIFCSVTQLTIGQVILDANGPGNTYEDINNVLAPSYNVIEAPDCNHAEFGRHIDEVFDSELNSNVFRFYIHTTPDNDRCVNIDRQRTEIKTYANSHDNLKATENETVVYKWKFKLPEGFQASSNFTHIHQIKSVGGLYSSMPMYTLTVRKGTPNRLELRYAETNSQVTLKQTDIAPFINTWVSVEETITFGNNGSYAIEIKNTSTNATLFSHTNNTIINWQTGADFARPKWGIYRSLINDEDLRDEEVLFANFSIEETQSLSNAVIKTTSEKITLAPNPAKQIVSIKNIKAENYNKIQVFDSTGKKVLSQKQGKDHQVDISSLSSGLYQITLLNSNLKVKTLKFIVE